MKKVLCIGLPALVLGLAVYGQVAGWYDARNLYHPSAEEGKAVGSVENLQSLPRKDTDKFDHVTIFTLVGEDGTVLNLGIDYDNFAFKEGDRLEIVYAKKIEEAVCEHQRLNSANTLYRARWYPVVNYRFVKPSEPAMAAEHGGNK